MMKERWNAIDKKYILLAVVILVQIVYLSCMFGLNKQGFHSDELWNYGFANSTDRTHVFQMDKLNLPENVNSWQSAELLKNYITVAKDGIFNYAAIYRNAGYDYNPPFGYMLLHFVCSFFPGTWSKWYCFVVNMAAFALTQVYLYKLVQSITGDAVIGMAACLFYGFTVGALDIAVFLRIYAPAVAFAVMLAYYAHEFFLHKDEKEKHGKILLKIFIASLLGCYTLNLFLVLAFCITAVYCVYYLFSRRIKALLKYGFTMLGSVAASALIFPVNIQKALFFLGLLTYTDANGEQVSYGDSFANSMYPAAFQFKVYWAYLTNDLFGVHTSPWATMTTTYIGYGLLVLVFILVPVCFVFRNEEWLHALWHKLKKLAGDMWRALGHSWFTLVALFGAMLGLIFVNANRTTIYGMGRVSNRYIFLLYPLMAAFAAALAGCLVKCLAVGLFRRKWLHVGLCVVVAVVFAVFSNLMSPKPYYYTHEETGVTLHDLEEDSNSIIVLSNYWLMTCLTCEMYDTGSYYLTDYDNALTQDCSSTEVDLSAPLYLIVDTSGMDRDNAENFFGATIQWGDEIGEVTINKQDYLDYYAGQGYSTKCELVGTDAIYGRPLEIYRLN
jgi:hypothetical protein